MWPRTPLWSKQPSDLPGINLVLHECTFSSSLCLVTRSVWSRISLCWSLPMSTAKDFRYLMCIRSVNSRIFWPSWITGRWLLTLPRSHNYQGRCPSLGLNLSALHMWTSLGRETCQRQSLGGNDVWPLLGDNKVDAIKRLTPSCTNKLN